MRIKKIRGEGGGGAKDKRNLHQRQADISLQFGLELQVDIQIQPNLQPHRLLISVPALPGNHHRRLPVVIPAVAILVIYVDTPTAAIIRRLVVAVAIVVVIVVVVTVTIPVTIPPPSPPPAGSAPRTRTLTAAPVDADARVDGREPCTRIARARSRVVGAQAQLGEDVVCVGVVGGWAYGGRGVASVMGVGVGCHDASWGHLVFFLFCWVDLGDFEAEVS